MAAKRKTTATTRDVRQSLIYKAKEAFVAPLDGNDFSVNPGMLFDADHALVRNYPQLFEAAPVYYDTERVEQATAAPGERR